MTHKIATIGLGLLLACGLLGFGSGCVPELEDACQVMGVECAGQGESLQEGLDASQQPEQLKIVALR